MYRTFILIFQGVVYLAHAALVVVVIYPRLVCAVVFYYG